MCRSRKVGWFATAPPAVPELPFDRAETHQYLVCLLSFCLKGEALDGKSPVVIDYTPYLKFTQR